jgi:hypothetical protein
MGETMIAPPALRVRDLVKEFEVYAKPSDIAIELLLRRRLSDVVQFVLQRSLATLTTRTQSIASV